MWTSKTSFVITNRSTLKSKHKCLVIQSHNRWSVCFPCYSVFATDGVREMPPPVRASHGLRLPDGAARDPRARLRHIGHHPGQRCPDTFTARVQTSPILLLVCVSKGALKPNLP